MQIHFNYWSSIRFNRYIQSQIANLDATTLQGST